MPRIAPAALLVLVLAGVSARPPLPPRDRERRAAGGDLVSALPHGARVRPQRPGPQADVLPVGIAAAREPGAVRPRERQPLEPAGRTRDQRPLPRYRPPAAPARRGDLGTEAATPIRDTLVLSIRGAVHI